MIPGTLTRGPGLNVAFGEPWAVEEDYDLVVLHARSLLGCDVSILLLDRLTVTSSSVVIWGWYRRLN